MVVGIVVFSVVCAVVSSVDMCVVGTIVVGSVVFSVVTGVVFSEMT